MNVKQWIIIRRDLHMRRGKEIAQGSHASMMFLTERLNTVSECNLKNISILSGLFTDEERHWIDGNFTKVTLQVNSREELLALHEKAKLAGLTSHLVLDSGLTEFNGNPTYTALAIGPHEAEKVQPIVSSLPLY